MRTFWDKQPVPQEGLNYKRGEDIEKEKKVVEEPVKLPNGFSWKVCSVKEAHPLLSDQYLDGKTNILRYSLETLKWAGESPVMKIEELYTMKHKNLLDLYRVFPLK